MDRILLISIDDIKNNTIIEQNLEDHVILPNVLSAHTINLQEVLGTDLYVDLLNKVKLNTTNADEDFLIDNYLFNYLITCSLHRCLPYLWAKAENSSVVLKEDEKSKSIDLDTLKYLRSDIKNDENFLEQRIIKYLCLNSDKFPKYCLTNDDVSAISSPYNKVGIYIDTPNKNCFS